MLRTQNEKSYVVQTNEDYRVERCILMARPILEISFSTPPAAPAPPPTSPRVGAGAGLRLTPLAWRSPWRAPASWERVTTTTCLPTAATVNSRRRRLKGKRPRRHFGLTAISARGSCTSGCPTLLSSPIAHNAEIDVIWERYEEELAPLRAELSEVSGQSENA